MNIIPQFCLLFAGTLGVSVMLMPWARSLAVRLDLLDKPDGRRKTHTCAVPVVGGIVVFLSCSMVLAASALLWGLDQQSWVGSELNWFGLLWGAGILVLVGAWDDWKGLRGRHKLLGQLIAISGLMISGTLVRSIRLFDWQMDLGILAYPFTIFWLLGAINSLNLLDGLDGLLGSVGVIICLAMAVMALLTGQLACAGVAIALAGALVGFLLFNLPPASVYMGDAGSMLVGLMVGVLAIQSSLKAPATVALAAPLVVLTIPIFDTLMAIVRRKLTGRSIYTTDRGHLHHCLLRCGLDRTQVLVWVICLCLIVVLGVFASLALNNEFFALLTGAAVVGVLVCTRLFGHAEFVLAKKRLLGLLHSSLRFNVEGNPRGMEVHLQGSANWQELWKVLVHQILPYQVDFMALDVNAPAFQESYHARWGNIADTESECPRRWHAVLPLLFKGQPVGRLELTGQKDEASFGHPLQDWTAIVEQLEEQIGMLLSPRPVTREERPRLTARLSLTGADRVVSAS